jgi:hypothetical protein
LIRNVALVLALGLTASVAAADTTAPNAKEQFANATRLYESRAFAEALPLFQWLVISTSSPNARLYAARCLAELDRLPEAYDELSATVREAASRAETDAKYAATRDAAASELAVIEHRIARVIVALTDAPAGTVVRLNGAAVPPERIGMTRPVMPGKLVVVATTPDGQTTTRVLDLPAGATQTVLLAIPRSVAPPPTTSASASSSAPAPPPPSPATRTWRTAGFAALGVGALGAALLTVEGLRAHSKNQDLRSGCGNTRCTDPRFADTIDQGKSAQTWANVGLVVGAVGLLAGASFLVADARAHGEPAVSLDVGPDRFVVGYRRALPW